MTYIQTITEFRTDVWQVVGVPTSPITDTIVVPLSYPNSKRTSLASYLRSLNDYYFENGKLREGVLFRFLSQELLEQEKLLEYQLSSALRNNVTVLSNNFLHTPSSALFLLKSGHTGKLFFKSSRPYGRTLTLEPGANLIAGDIRSSSRFCGDTGVIHCHGRKPEITRIQNVMVAGGNPSITKRPNSLIHIDDGISCELENCIISPNEGVNAVTINGYHAHTGLVSQISFANCDINGHVLIVGSPDKENPVRVTFENTYLPEDSITIRGEVELI